MRGWDDAVNGPHQEADRGRVPVTTPRLPGADRGRVPYDPASEVAVGCCEGDGGISVPYDPTSEVAVGMHE